jgi:hypothetical protein
MKNLIISIFLVLSSSYHLLLSKSPFRGYLEKIGVFFKSLLQARARESGAKCL